ncbi:MAG: UDP-N-acetylmuramate dehydrogenase [Prevotella sp.]|nr:UDP-N-acetylmuramate dehydrogenase [Prevotella sp.]
MKDERNYSLKGHNTFGIDARCQRFLEYTNAEEAKQVAQILHSERCPFLILGGGSNLLLTRDFEGIVVHSAIMGIEVDEPQDNGDRLVRAGSGENWDEFVDFCVANGLYGAENLSLIPGEVGASAVQNIGAYGAEAKDIIEKVEVLDMSDGQVKWLDNAQCQYGYRQSRFKGEWKNRFLILSVVFRLHSCFEPHLDYGNIRAELERRHIDNPTASEVRQVIIDIRNAKLPDPNVQGNAGSFFMNPVVGRDVFEQIQSRYPNMPHYYIDETHEKIPAGWMIDQCGWKGRSLGRAGVHDKQALVLVNRGGATGSEVVALCDAIRHDVLEKFGIDIHPEVNII